MQTEDHKDLANEIQEVYGDLELNGGWYELSKDEVHDLVIDYNYEGDYLCTLIDESEEKTNIEISRVTTVTTTETRKEVICPKCGMVLTGQQYLDKHNKDFPDCENECDTNKYPRYRNKKQDYYDKKLNEVVAQNKRLEAKVDMLSKQLSLLIQKIN